MKNIINSHLQHIDDLSPYIDYDEFLSILKELYGLVFVAHHTHQTDDEFMGQVRQFEKAINMPDIFSHMPVDEFISQLETMQYLYPLVHREVTLPRFN